MTGDHRDRAGRTPLHYAVIDPPRNLPFIAAQTDPELDAENHRKGNEYKIANTTKLLMKEPMSTPPMTTGRTPLHFAAKDDSADVVRILLGAGGDIDAHQQRRRNPAPQRRPQHDTRRSCHHPAIAGARRGPNDPQRKGFACAQIHRALWKAR